MPVQGPSQTFRDGFSMAGMSQVLIVLCIDNYIFIYLFVYVNILDFLNLSFIYCQDFLGDDFKSQGSHVPYNVADFSTQVHIKEIPVLLCNRAYVLNIGEMCVWIYLMLETYWKLFTWLLSTQI